MNFITLKDHVALDMTATNPYVKGTSVAIKKKGIFTQYPYNIGDVGTTSTVQETHVYGQIAKGEVWLTFTGNTDQYKSIYLSTYGKMHLYKQGIKMDQQLKMNKKLLLI